jgi:hypothetical protein
MNLSYKTIELLYLLALVNFLFALSALIQFQPEIVTAKYVITAGAGLLVSLVLLFRIMKIHHAANRAQPRLEPRFNSRLKEQLWGMWIRLVSGVAGLGLVALLVDLPLWVFLCGCALYFCVMVGGIIFDGRRFDDFHHEASLDRLLKRYPPMAGGD